MERLDSVLSDAAFAALRAQVEGFGPYRTYVAAQQQQGLGKGLVRRHDALMNHMIRGGMGEGLEALAARVNLFRGTYAEAQALRVPGGEALFTHPAFLAAAERISGRPVVRPSMLYANVLVPGQVLPIHTDTPAFGALDQSTTPEWLLVCMGHSGLFEPWRTPTVGVVTFLTDSPGGAFVAFPDGPEGAATHTAPMANTAVMLDPELVFHGVARVGGPDAPVPPSAPGTWIEHTAGDRWTLRAKGEAVAEYRWDALRVSFQWKAKCLPADGDAPPTLTRAEAEARLIEDLRARGVVGDALPNETQLAVLMIQTYVRFPSAGLA